MVLGNQPTNNPTNKVVAGTVAAAVTTLVVALVQGIWDVNLDVLVQGAITTILTFAAGYLMPNPAPDAPPEPLVVPEDEVGD